MSHRPIPSSHTHQWCRGRLWLGAVLVLVLVSPSALASTAASSTSCSNNTTDDASAAGHSHVAVEDEATANRIRSLMSAGLARYRESEYGEAVRLMGQAVQLRPSDPELVAYLGNSLFRDGRTDEALGRFRQAIDLDQGQHARYWSNLGSVLFHSKRYQEAIDCYTKAAELDPSDGTLQKNVDTARLYLQTSSLILELEGGQASWNLSTIFTGVGWRPAVETTLVLALEQRPDLLPTAIHLLRQAVGAERAAGRSFATAEHVLANTLVRLADLLPAEEEGGRRAELLEEARQLLDRSIKAGGGSRAAEAGPALWRAGHWPGLWPWTKLHVVTVATAHRHELDNLKDSCEVLGWDLVVLGSNSTWSGLGSKLRLLQEWLASTPGVRADDVLLFVDAYDVLALPTAGHQLFQRFETVFRHAPIVMSGETGCAPDPAARLLYPYASKADSRPPPPLPYVNSGGYLGFVGAVRAMLLEVTADIEHHHSLHGASATQLDDQRWVTRYVLRHQQQQQQEGAMVAVDGQGAIFHTLHHVDPELLSISGFGLRVNVTSAFTNGSTPCLLHGNGDGLAAFHTLSTRLQRQGWPPHAFLEAHANSKQQQQQQKMKTNSRGGTTSALPAKQQQQRRRRPAAAPAAEEEGGGLAV